MEDPPAEEEQQQHEPEELQFGWFEADQFESAEDIENSVENLVPRRSARRQRYATNNTNGNPSTRRRGAPARANALRATPSQRAVTMQNAIRRSNGQDLEYKQKILRALTQITRSFELVIEQQADTTLMFWQAVAAESRNLRPDLYTQFKTDVIDKLAEYIRLNHQTFENEL